MNRCSVTGCDRKYLCKGYCGLHYQRVQRDGEPGPVGVRDRRGDGNSNWRGGRVRLGHENRYWARHTPDHPAANPAGYVLEHRLVAEQTLGRLLRDDEVVHHVNHDPIDNRPENLQVMSRAEHVRVHANRYRRNLRDGEGMSQSEASDITLQLASAGLCTNCGHPPHCHIEHPMACPAADEGHEHECFSGVA